MPRSSRRSTSIGSGASSLPCAGAAIVAAAEGRGVVAMTGFNQRYRDGYRRLHDTARGGALGRLHHFWCQRFGMGAGALGSAAGRGWRTDPATLCGMTIESLSRDTDLLRWIMADEVASVADGYQALRVSHAILESAGTGKTVRLD